MSDLNDSFRQYRLANPGNYSKRSGNIKYLDSDNLNHPLTMSSRKARWTLLIIVIVAILIGYKIIDSTVLEAQRQYEQSQATIASYVASEASIKVIPSLTHLASLDDETIMAEAQQAGAIYDIAAAKGETGVSYYRFPTSVSAEEGTALYAKGISSLSGVEAAKILAGGYYVSVSHDVGTTVIVRYADFTSATTSAVFDAAVTSQGFDPATVTESGTDDTGNDYETGTIEANGTTYTWRISVLPLSDMYDVQGLPSNAHYVGIRLQSA